MEYTPYTLPLIAATAIALGLALYAVRQRRVPGRVTFALLMLAVAVWAAGYALEIGGTAYSTKVFWAKVQYFGIGAIPVLWLRFVMIYVGESTWMTGGRFALLAIVPVITALLAWFNERFHLVWRDITLDRSLGFAMLDFDYGAAFWAYAGYSYLLLLTGALLLFRAIVRMPTLGARQGVVVLVAAIAPWLGNALYLTGTNPFPLLDLTPFGFVLTGLALAWGMSRFQFLGTLPVAHRAIIQGMQAGVIALDTADNIVELNPAAERMFDLRAEAAVGRPAQNVFADQPEVLEWVTARRETTIRGALVARGMRRDFDIRTMLLYDRRRHAGHLITFHDITKLANAEREADEARTVAEAASRAKSEFLANVSHEIRTPLNAIIGMTDLALDGELPAREREYLEVARASATSLLSIIIDILDFSKIEARKLELDRVAFDLHGLVDATVQMLAIIAAGKPLVVRAEVAPNVPRVVAGDPLRVRQILMNLLSNAIKFTAEGEVTMTVGVDDDASVPANRCRLVVAVTDTGIGIGEKDQRRVFESFAQADASTTRLYGGTGLGLAIASHLIALMEGQIGIESELGRGSTFTFTVLLDRVDEDAAADIAAAAERAAARGAADGSSPGARLPAGLRVLVAEDNVINQRVTGALLESRGHSVTIAGDGREAVEALAGGEFDLVLMDVQMPRVDGLEATRSIRAAEQWSGKHVPIIAITAHAGMGDRDTFLTAGMDAYVPKPLDAGVLFDTIAGVLDSNEGPTDGVGDAVPAEPVSGARPPVDRDAALTHLGGDEELLIDIIDIYRDDAPRVLEGLRAAVAAGDAEATWQAAHRIKGSVGNLAAQPAFEAARELEARGREGHADAELLARLEAELERLDTALIALRAEIAD